MSENICRPVLTPGDHEHFIEHGYVVVRGAVPETIIARAVAALETGARPDGDDPVAACTTDVMLDAIGELFGDAYPFRRRRGGHNMPRPHQPDAAWATPSAHVDDSYPTIMPNGWAVGSFIFLTRVQSHGGAFVYFPGSYRRYRTVMAQACHCVKGAAPLPDYSGPFREFLAEPGDVLLFHHLMGHTGSTNLVDPATRHALLSRWHPERRIVPGEKSFEEMTTIEKVNSARYLGRRFGQEIGSWRPTDGRTAALRDGFAAWENITTCAVLHFGGRLHLFFVESSAPFVIRRMVSDDFLTWQDRVVVRVTAGRVRSLHIHQYTMEVILAVGLDVTPGRARLFSSPDLEQWDLLTEVSGDAATPWYVYPQYPSKVAGGQAVFTVDAGAPSEGICRWGERWEEAGGWSTRSVAARTESGHIRDITVAAYVGDSNCAFVADVAAGSEADDTRLFYAQPKDIAVADAPLQPLPYDGATPPRQLRVVNRGRSYWLVTYLRPHEGRDRLFWGSIDWESATPTLRELTHMDAFEEAMAVVGFV